MIDKFHLNMICNYFASAAMIKHLRGTTMKKKNGKDKDEAMENLRIVEQLDSIRKTMDLAGPRDDSTFQQQNRQQQHEMYRSGGGLAGQVEADQGQGSNYFCQVTILSRVNMQQKD